ncbi:unnamed protein product [Symbiodinium sp. CCMP2592]|nr:unnamed protein product [Symbiodinium sp. CCMP2592]
MSTPSRPERTQFFDISDHDGDIPRPADLPPVPGALFPGGPTTAIPRSSLLGPIDHGSPPGCNAAPAEKASTVHSQTSGINLDDILRRAQQRVADDHPPESRGQNNPVEPVRQNYGQTSASFSGRSPIPTVPSTNAAGTTSGQAPSVRPFPVDDDLAIRSGVRYDPETQRFAPEPKRSPTFPCQISYDTRTVPAGKGPSRWYDAMLGRSNLIGSGSGAPVLQSETGTFTLAPNASVAGTLRPAATDDVDGWTMPPMPTFNARTSAPAPSAAPSGLGGPPPAHGGDGGPFGGGGPNDNGGAYGGGFGGHGHHGSGFGPGGGGGPPSGPPSGPPGGGGPPDGNGPPDGGLDPPSIRRSGRPSGNDTFQCERCTGTFPTTVRRSCISCRFSCCNGCCRDPLRICLVCLERQTGNPPGPNDTGFGGPKGDGSLSEAKKAKCKSFRLDPEPEPAQLRRWIVDMKERVANAFAYDPGYALSWVEIPDGTRYEDLLDECKYGMLENECNSAFRECVRSIALKNKIQTETERMHTINRRLGSRQILWLLYDFLRPHVTGDSTFKLVDLMKTTIDRFTHGSEQERLEAFSNRWDHVLAGISVDRPEDPVLCALFYEQVREFRCLELDMQLWDRDVSVRNYAYLRTVCVNAITTWRRRRNQEKMYTATRSTSAQRRYAERESVPKELAEALVTQTILPATRVAKAIFPQSGTSSSRTDSPDVAIPARRRAHMKAVLWREQVLLDDVDAKTLGNVVAGRPDLPRVYPALPAPIIIHEKIVAAGEEPVGELDDIGELDLDMPGAKGDQKGASDDIKKVPDKPKHQSPPDEPRARDLREEAKSIHHLMTHLPKNPYCDACQRAKMENVKSFRQDSPRDKGFEKFGEHVTIDTMVLHGLGNRGNNGETDAVVFYDLATEWLESVPVKGRTNADTLRAFQQVFGDLHDVNSFSMDVERRCAPSAIREIYCDKAREFISTCKRVGISVKHSTPGMPRTNAIAESKVKLVLHGARVALRQAGLSAKFWPYACKHFCHARNIELREGQSAYSLRFDGAEFDGQILPFGCLVDFYPTPARKQTRRSQKDEVVLGDGEEYAVPAPGDDGLVEIEVGFDDDGYLEWIDDGDGDRSGSLQGPDIDQRLSSYQRPSKFSPTSKPGIFLGYHFENGGKWDGDYIVADLEDFKRDALRASVHQVKKIYCSPKEQWTFPMLAVYDKQTRSVCINDPAMHSNVPKPSERLDASDMLDLEDIDEIFALDESTRMTDEDIRQAREAELRAESSHGGGADYWEYDPSVHKWTYHVVVPRKAMVHPSKTPGSIGESPDPWKLSTVRISHVQYKDKSPVTIYETGYAFGKTRLMQLWTGTVEFYDDGYAPPKKKLPPYHGSEILEGEGGLPYRQSVPRSERAYKGSRKPNSIDSESWRSMNRAEREGYVEAERREAESHAMSREDSRDAVPVDITYDSDYESGAERHDKDYWYHDVAAGTITQFHVIERRARFNPTSVKDCPVDPATLTDVRMTMAMTDGTEFTLQDSWRSSDTRSLPCRWTGKTVFVIGSSAKTQVKVRTRVPNTENTGRRVQTANGYYGHALRAKSRTVVPAKSRVCVVTDLEFEPPGGMSARLQPLRGSGLDVCPAMYTYNEGATQSGVDVFNPTDNDVIVEPGQDVAVVQFYTSVLAAVELDFTAEDVEGDVSAPVEPPDDGQAVDAAPAMPVRPDPHSHRSPDSSVFFYSACVARPVDRKERAVNPKAKAALDKEWNKLINQGCWDYASVREWRDVSNEAVAKGETAHVGRIFDICVEKNSELPESDPNRKFKGRVVFEGCHVKDEGNNWAIFSEITSCPATMEAGKAADAFGLLPGHEIQVADGESAYTQAKLGGPATWVRLPKDRWLPEWHGKYHDPVVRLVLALYGHPDAGGFWEQHCEKALRSVGFEQCPDWKSVFRHPKLNLMLVVYVDDFKLSGPKANLAKGWELMASKIKLEPPSSIKRYLGCEHVTFSHVVPSAFDPRSYWTRFEEPKKAFPELTFGDRGTSVAQGSVGPREIRMIKYDMRSFMEQCVSRYVELCGPKYKATLRSADTPFLDESRPEFDTNPDRPAVNRLMGHPVDTPVPPGKGILGDCAAAVLMKILYGARMGRYDLIRPVQALASLITKWDGLCDKKLHRLVCYINSTLDLNLYGWIGDAPEMLELVLYCDADLAGDRTDSKSTSGVFMCLLGPRSFMPLNALSKKQTSVSKSTPEAEIVSLDHAVYKLGLPALSMWEYMMGRRFQLRVMEDNEAAIRVVITGHNPNMRHMSRTQRIDISALNERYHAGDFLFVTCPSQFEAGDILTKACTDAKVWGRNLMSIGHFRKGTLISSGMLSAAPALPALPSVCPTRGVHLETGHSPFNDFIIDMSRQGGVSIDDAHQFGAAVKCIHIGGEGIIRFPHARSINLSLDDNAKGIAISNIRVPPTPAVCIVTVPIAGTVNKREAGFKNRGWKEMRGDLKEKGWEARKLLGYASAARSSGIPVFLVLPKGNPLWGREYIRRWSESHELCPVKLCSCSSGRCSQHAWMCEIFMPARFGPVFMSRFACNHKKAKRADPRELRLALWTVLEHFMNSAIFGSQQSALPIA